MIKNNIGLKTIASELNLSINTVSHALRDCDDISQETKKIVRAKAVELGYIPNSIAQSLRSGKSQIIAIVLDNIASPYFGMIVEMMIREFAQRNYYAMVVPATGYKLTEDLIKECIKIKADAVVTFIVPEHEAVIMATLNKLPLLLFGRTSSEPNLNIVYTDDIQGGEQAAEYLISKGCRNLAYAEVSTIECSIPRRDGFIKRAQELGIKNVVSIDATYFEQNVEKIVSSGVDGIFCFNDQLASRIINKMHDNDHYDSQKIKVIGYDAVSRILDYPFDITSIQADYSKMAKDATDILLRQVEESNSLPSTVKKYDVHLFLGNS
jgi:LacI family transcriptional regulator